MSDELPIGRLLERVAPRLHDFLVDPFGKYPPKEEKSEEGVRLQKIEIVPALPPPRPIVTTVGVPVVERVPEIQIEL